MDRDILVELLIQDEGIRLKPYFDCCGRFFRDCICERQGKLTLGIGRNIEDVGLSYQESLILLESDVNTASRYAKNFKWFSRLNPARQCVIVMMIVNLGMHKFRGFKRMIAALENQNYDAAAVEMLDSLWAIQVKGRAARLAEIMSTGRLPENERKPHV